MTSKSNYLLKAVSMGLYIQGNTDPHSQRWTAGLVIAGLFLNQQYSHDRCYFSKFAGLIFIKKRRWLKSILAGHRPYHWLRADELVVTILRRLTRKRLFIYQSKLKARADQLRLRDPSIFIMHPVIARSSINISFNPTQNGTVLHLYWHHNQKYGMNSISIRSWCLLINYRKPIAALADKSYLNPNFWSACI